MRIVIVGGSFGGLTVAFELRKIFSRSRLEITVISKDENFVFIPSLPWVAMGEKTIGQISFGLERPLAKQKIDFVRDAAVRIDPGKQTVITDRGEYQYDYLVIATGHRSANEAVPGLGPFDGPGHSLMSPPEAVEAREALKHFLENPGPVVAGCAPGASCIGPAYEFVFELDYLLRRRKMRHKVPITFITPEPFLGHFGVGGMGKVRQMLEAEFDGREIRYQTSSAISKITASSVELSDGQAFASNYSLIIPPLAGVRGVAGSPGLANPKGFIPVDEHYRHKEFPNIYAVGVAVAFPPVDETPVAVNFPKTAHMTSQMARMAANNIAADINGGEKQSRALFTECIMDMGNTAAHMVADPVRPPRNISRISEGRRWLLAKRMFANYYLWNAKRGRMVGGGRGW